MNLKSISRQGAEWYPSPTAEMEDLAAGKNLPPLQFCFRPDWIKFLRDKGDGKKQHELRSQPWAMPMLKSVRGSEVREKPGWCLSLKLYKEGLAKKGSSLVPNAGEKKKNKGTRDCRNKTLLGLGEGTLGYQGH